jgi:glycolate oxidase FAD binding subunit
VDLIAPASRAELAAALRAASAAGRRLLPVGGRTHLAKGNPASVDAALTVTALDRLVEHTPAEMIAVVEAGMRCDTLDGLLAGHRQEWPVDAPAGATVGGVVAAAASGPRRLRVGPVRDSVLEVELVTGDGREVRGGARTVKNVSGYDLPRLVEAAGDAWAALAGVGVCWAGLPAGGATLAELRQRADELGGVAPVVHGVGGLGAALPAPAIHRRLKQAFDPAGILAPGRFWGEL